MKIGLVVATHLGGNIVNKYMTIQVDANFLSELSNIEYDILIN